MKASDALTDSGQNSPEEAEAQRLTADFPWGEPADLFWEARDAGWGAVVLRAYLLGLKHGDGPVEAPTCCCRCCCRREPVTINVAAPPVEQWRDPTFLERLQKLVDEWAELQRTLASWGHGG